MDAHAAGSQAGSETGVPTHHVTFFRDASATSMTSADLTPEELAARIGKATAPTKSKLPWLKMARFGKKKTDKGSLRHDKNVVEITGVELDYDAMQVTFADAVACIRDMRIAAIVYTSPSHQDAKPKWRVLAPTSRPLPPNERAHLVARINGAMGAPIKKVESFTLSQSYYFGQARDNPSPNHQVVVCDGRFIDERDDLAQYEKAGYVGTGDTPRGDDDSNAFTDAADGIYKNPEEARHGFDSILKSIGDGEVGLTGFNDALSRAAASYVALHNGNPFDPELLKALLREAINKAPKGPDRDPKTIERYLSDGYLDNIIKSATKKFVNKYGFNIKNFVAYLPQHQYIYLPTRDLWPASSVNTLPPVPVKDIKGRPVVNKKTGAPRTEPAAHWLDKNQNVQQMTWAPGEPMVIEDRLVNNGGWVEQPGSRCFNTYLPPVLKRDVVNASEEDVRLWLDHIKLIYPDDWQHLVKWLAHRVQRPGDKVNHALMLGGHQGIGKDTLLAPLRVAVGSWNFQEVSPSSVVGRFNGFLKSVILRVSETRDLGEINRYTFYEKMKTYTAAPPEVLRVDEKNTKEYYVFNVCGVIYTTNEQEGQYLPADDRRTYVAWSSKDKQDFSQDYWDQIWNWYTARNGFEKVALFLERYDLASFNPKAPPPKTQAFHKVVSHSNSAEACELHDMIDALGHPDSNNPDGPPIRPNALITDQLREKAIDELGFESNLVEMLNDPRKGRAIASQLDKAGYTVLPNPKSNADGYWLIKFKEISGKIVRRRRNIYVLKTLGAGKQLEAAEALADQIR